MSEASKIFGLVLGSIAGAMLLSLVAIIIIDIWLVWHGHKSISYHVQNWAAANPGLFAFAALVVGFIFGAALGGLVGHFLLPEKGN